MVKQARIVAAVFAFAAVLVVLSSSIFLIEHANHDCTGVDCPVCEQLYHCAQNLKIFTTAEVIALSAAGFTVVSRIILRGATRNGADLHSYQPTAEDMVKISECDTVS